MAIASLVCGIVAPCTVWVAAIPAILAVVFGFVARGQIKQRQQSGGGMALAGIILGFVWIALFVIAVIVIIVAAANGDSSCETYYGSC